MREQWIPGALLPNYRAPGNEAMAHFDMPVLELNQNWQKTALLFYRVMMRQFCQNKIGIEQIKLVLGTDLEEKVAL